MLNRDDNLFLTLKCRFCQTQYVFYKDMKVAEVCDYLEKHSNCSSKQKKDLRTVNGKAVCMVKGWVQ